MFSTCPYCDNPVPIHGRCCRIPHDLDRFERVYQRLHTLHENAFLQSILLRYLVAYGRRDDQPVELHCVRGGANSATTGAW